LRKRLRLSPQAQVSQDFLHDYTLVNHGNHPHYVLTDWATERVGVPDRQRQAGDRRLKAGHLLRKERNKPFRTLQVSRDNAPSSRYEGSARNPRREASPTWYSTSQAEP